MVVLIFLFLLSLMKEKVISSSLTDALSKRPDPILYTPVHMMIYQS